MMNQYSIPKRQDARALVILFFQLLYKIAKVALPFLVLVFFKKTTSLASLYTSLIILGVTAIFSFLNYWFFKYHITEDEFRIKKGWIKTSSLSVPLDRVQTVNITQNLLQKLLNIVSLEVDTAGSKETEIKLFALTAKEAKNLKQILDPQKIKQVSEDETKEEETSEKSKINALKKQYLTYLDAFDLMKVALGENHIKSLLMVIAVPIIFVSQFFSEFEEEIKQAVDKTVTQADVQSYDFTFFNVIEILVFALLLGFLVSFIKTFVLYYDFRFGISNQRLVCRYGLFKTKEINVLKEKIQYYTFYTNPLKRLIGHKGLELRTASSGSKKEKNSIITVPACKTQEEQKWKKLLIALNSESMSCPYYSHSFYFIKKFFIQTLLFMGLAFLPLLFVGDAFLESFRNTPFYFWYIFFWAGVELYIVVAIYLSFKKYYFQYSDDILSVSKGAIGQKNYFIKIYKIQSVSLSQNIFMKKRKVSNIIIHTASDEIKIPYINEVQARKLYAFLIEKIELSTKKWM